MGATATRNDVLSIPGLNSQEIGKLKKILRIRPHLTNESPQARPRLVGANNTEEMVLPEGIYKLLCDIVPLLKQGDPVFLVPESKALTTQETADLLGMSRPYLVKLLEQGELPFFRVGAHRRILLKDILTFRDRRDAERSDLLDDFIALSDELGAYGPSSEEEGAQA